MVNIVGVFIYYLQYVSMLMDYGSHDACVSWASEERRVRLLVYSISQDNNGSIYIVHER